MRRSAYLAMVLCLLILTASGGLPALGESIVDAQPVCAVFIDGEEQAVYQTAVCLYRTWTSRPPLSTTPVVVATRSGSVEIEARFDAPVESALVRPLTLGIEPEIDGNAVRFAAQAPGQLTLEINGGVENALHLFLNAPDEAPDPEAENVCYYGSGVHEERQIVLRSGETLYLDDGCVLYGSVFAQGAQDVAIAGHGVLSGAIYDRFADVLVPVNFENCRNVSIRDVTILDPAAWTLQLYKTEGAVIDNVKIVGARSNSDGITLQSCRDVAVTNCFVRSWDDSLVVKGYDGDVSDIRFENVQIWTDLAQSCEIGYETRADVIENISFKDITVLHNFHKPVLSIHNSDNALVQNILYENVVVEDAEMGEGDGQPFLIDLTTNKSQWSQTKERGSIRDVTFRNITVLSGKEPSIRIFSGKKDSNIDGVLIDGLTILGKRITSFDELKYNSSPKNGENIEIQ